MKDKIREIVAGAARSLWMNYGVPEATLKCAYGMGIVHAEAMRKLVEKDLAFSHITLSGFAHFSTMRRMVAGAAEYLVTSRGATQEWLIEARCGEIEECARVGRAADQLNMSVALPFNKVRDTSLGDPLDRRAYTLEDMRTAYRMGFLAATDRTEAAVAYFNTNEFSDDREAALGRL